MAQPGIPAALSDRRWVILSVVVVARLMVVLHSTVVNIALPSAQRALGFPGRSERPRCTIAFTAVTSCLAVHRTGPLAPRSRQPAATPWRSQCPPRVLGPGAILAAVLLPSRHRLAELRNAATAMVAPASA
jgi:hypothetical protein